MPGVVPETPPIVLLPTPSTKTPSLAWPDGPAMPIPSAVVPMKLPAIVSPPLPDRWIDQPWNPSITSPRTVELPAVIARPSTAPVPVAAPLSSTSGWPLVNPGSVVPSIVTGSVTAGSAEAGEIVWTPELAIAKAIRS